MIGRSANRAASSWRPVWWPLLAAALSGLLVVTSVQGASAYVLEGQKWNGTPNSGCCAYIHVNYQGNMLPGDRGGWDNAVAAWTSSPANIILQKLPGNLNVSDYNNPSDTRDGYTLAHWSGRYFTTSNSYLNGHFTNNYTAAQIEAVAVHELGHAMGLAHVPTCAGIMYHVSTACPPSTPHQDDINGINALY